MATVIYRYEKGELETHRVEAKHLQSHLDCGWSLTKEAKKESKAPTKEENNKPTKKAKKKRTNPLKAE